MDYRILQIQSNPDNKFAHSGEQNTVLQNGSLQQSSLQDFNTKPTLWTCHQKLSFIMYWIHRFLQSPLEVCSFSAPLSRKLHFQEVSNFIRNELGQQFYKSREQCKTRFSVIKRRVLRQRSKGKKPSNYDFLDYVIEEARTLCRRGTSNQGRGELAVLLLKLQSLNDEEGEFMRVSKQMKLIQHGWQVELKNNEIFKYLKENQREMPDLF